MIEIRTYNPDWPVEFMVAAQQLQGILGRTALRIAHIGSTAVPGLCAKDVIDVQVTVVELSAGILDAMVTNGFRHNPKANRDHVPPGGDPAEGLWQKLFFREPEGERRMNIHLRKAGCPNQRYALLFRDFLIAHPHYANAYGELKRRLAATVAEELYPDVKDPAVDLIYFAAEEWAVRAGWRPER